MSVNHIELREVRDHTLNGFGYIVRVGMHYLSHESPENMAFSTYAEALEVATNLSLLYDVILMDHYAEMHARLQRIQLRDHYRNTSHGKAD